MEVGPDFKVCAQDTQTQARCGILKTAHGDIYTPVFMPVGTQGTVKGLSSEELKTAGAQIILGNAYHLYLRPGIATIKTFGGLHGFMAWDRPLLTDSGGFQIFSLARFCKILPEGIEFKSHLDGSRHLLTPEQIITIQQTIGSDLIMPLDECVKYPSDKSRVEASLAITADWARRSKKQWQSNGGVNDYGNKSLLFGIVQGGVYRDLRTRAAEQIVCLDFSGYSIGGLSVGEPRQLMAEMLHHTAGLLPKAKPRYLMGVGTPADLLEAVASGVDMFDCVIPTRNGRHATVFTSSGKLLLRSAACAKDQRPIEESCACYACRTYSRAYLHHLFAAQEPLGGRLASLHNITFFIELLESMRQAIEQNRFVEFCRQLQSQVIAKE